MIVLRFNDTSTLVGHLCHLPEEGRKGKKRKIQMKERDREERGTVLKGKKQKKQQELSEDNAAHRKGLIQ